MKFAIEYEELLKIINKEGLSRIINSFKNEENKFYIIKHSDLKVTENEKKHKKLVEKLKKKLEKKGIPYSEVIVSKDDFASICKRNYIDYVITNDKDNMEQISKIENVEVLSFKHYVELRDKIVTVIEEGNKPLLFSEAEISNYPSKDKIWLKYYNKQMLKTYNRLLCDKTSMFRSVIEHNQDFLYETMIDYNCQMTYGEYKEKVLKAKAGFLAQGIKPNDKVGVCTPNVVGTLIAIAALQEIGAIPSMMHVYSSIGDIKGYIEKDHMKAIVMIGMDATYKNVKEAIKNTNIEKVFIIPLEDSMPFVKKLGIKILTSRFGKIVTMINHEKKKYKTFKNGELKLKDCIVDFFSNVKKIPTQEKIKYGEIFIPWSEIMKYSATDINDYIYNESAVILHTGGTTAFPKSAVLTHENIYTNASAFIASIPQIERRDKMLTIPPVFHVFGFNNCTYLGFLAGCRVILVHKYDKAQMAKDFKKYNPQYFFAVPKLVQDMVDNPHLYDDVSFKDIKYIALGGTEMSTKFLTAAQKLVDEHGGNIKIGESLGFTEGSCSVTNSFSYANVLGSLGIPLINIDAKIVKMKDPSDSTYEDIEELGYDQTGEMCFSGSSIMKEYYNDPISTTLSLRIHPDGKKWIHIGDAGHITKDGFLFYDDRIKEMEKINGEQVFPSEIKKVVEMHPNVDKCAIVFIDCDGKKVVVAVVTSNDETKSPEPLQEEIKQICSQHLMRESVPVLVDVRKELPETMYYKVDKNEIRKELKAKKYVFK